VVEVVTMLRDGMAGVAFITPNLGFIRDEVTGIRDPVRDTSLITTRSLTARNDLSLTPRRVG
jgi:hypothetical protein